MIIISLTAFACCNDDFVNVDSNDINSEDYFNSEEDYQNALIGAYDLLQATYINVMLGEIASDNTLAGGESATDVIGIQEIDDMINNPKIKNSQEIFVVARDQQAANEIYDLNDPVAKATVHNRKQAIENADGDQISFTEFNDVRQDIVTQSHQQAISKIKGG